MPTSWSLLAPDTGESRRRSRGLGVIGAVRRFNELAVPGLGGVWFAKPLVWSLLGIQLAEREGGRNIASANAVESLGCWLGLRELGEDRDPRIQGMRKLGGIGSKRFVPFRRATRGGFYVTTPMRMGTGQPLLELGLVRSRSTRFNAFRLAKAGERLLELALAEQRWHNKEPQVVLREWARAGRELPPRALDTSAGRTALSPLHPLPEAARTALDGRLFGVGAGIARREAVRAWLRSDEVVPTWSETPPAALDTEHWRDLRVGAAFVLARDAALAVLDAAEARVRQDGNRKLELDDVEDGLPGRELGSELAAFREAAAAFLAHDWDPSPRGLATELCGLGTLPDDELVGELVERDGTGLILRGRTIRAGTAFPPDGATVDALRDDADDIEPPSLALPPGISPRVRNLYTLDLDLQGCLGVWLKPEDS